MAAPLSKERSIRNNQIVFEFETSMAGMLQNFFTQLFSKVEIFDSEISNFCLKKNSTF